MFDFQEFWGELTGRIFENVSASKSTIAFFVVIFVLILKACFRRDVCFLLGFFSSYLANHVLDDFQFGGSIQFIYVVFPEVSDGLFDGFTRIYSIEFKRDLIEGCRFSMELS